MKEKKSSGILHVIQSNISILFGITKASPEPKPYEEAIRAPITYLVDKGQIGTLVASHTDSILVLLVSKNEILNSCFGEGLRFIVKKSEFDSTVRAANEARKITLEQLEGYFDSGVLHLASQITTPEPHHLYIHWPKEAVSEIHLTDLKNETIETFDSLVDKEKIRDAMATHDLTPGKYRLWAVGEDGVMLNGFAVITWEGKS